MVGSMTCTPCRSRKVKCDGGSPLCGPCSRARQSLDCIYDKKQPTTRKRKNPLRKGEACLPCRRKKKGCNAMRPFCRTCETANKEHECIYEDSIVQTPTQPAILRPREFRHFRYQETLEDLKHTAFREECCDLVAPSQEDDQSSPVCIIGVTSPDTSSFSSPLQREFFPSTAASSFLDFPSQSSQPPLPSQPGINSNYFARLMLTDVESPLPYAVSNVSLNDMNMNLIIFLAHRLQFGFYFAFANQQAILLGDTSHTFIHPFYIYFAEMVGCHLYQERRLDFSLLYIEAMHLQLTFEALASMREEDDPFQLARAFFFLALACLYTQNLPIGKRYMKRAFDIVKRNNIRFIPLSTVNTDLDVFPPIPEFSEDVHERAAFLGQMIYSEIDLQLVIGDPMEFSFDLVHQFQHELPNAYPILFQTCPITLRAKSIILVKDANNFIFSFHDQTLPAISWITECQIFVSSLQRHLDDLASQLIQFAKIRDHDSCVSLRYSSIICLTTMAEIYNLLAQHPLASSTSSLLQDKCSNALNGIVTMTEGLVQDDFNFLDPFLGICWSHAIRLFKQDRSSSKPFYVDPSQNSNFGVASHDATEASIIIMSQSKDKLDVTICLTPYGPGSLCSKLANHDHRRKPGVPNFLREEVRIAYGF